MTDAEEIDDECFINREMTIINEDVEKELGELEEEEEEEDTKVHQGHNPDDIDETKSNELVVVYKHEEITLPRELSRKAAKASLIKQLDALFIFGFEKEATLHLHHVRGEMLILTMNDILTVHYLMKKIVEMHVRDSFARVLGHTLTFRLSRGTTIEVYLHCNSFFILGENFKAEMKGEDFIEFYHLCGRCIRLFNQGKTIIPCMFSHSTQEEANDCEICTPSAVPVTLLTY